MDHIGVTLFLFILFTIGTVKKLINNTTNIKNTHTGLLQFS